MGARTVVLSIVLGSMLVASAALGGIFAVSLTGRDGAGGEVVPVAQAPRPTILDTPVSAAIDDLPGLVERVRPSVVRIAASSGSGFGGQGVGTGLMIDREGNILTNFHVIDGARTVTVDLTDGTQAAATVVGTDPGNDLAVLKADLPASKIVPATLGNSDVRARRRTGLRHRQPVWPRVHGHQRHHQRSRARALRGGRPADSQRPPDRRRGEPGELGRPAVQRARRGGGHQHLDRESHGPAGLRRASASRCHRTPPRASCPSSSRARPRSTRSSASAASPSMSPPPRATASASPRASTSPVSAPAAPPSRPACAPPTRAGAGGDVVTAIDGRIVRSIGELAGIIDSHAVGETVTLAVQRGREQVQLRAVLREWQSG